ncbi:glycoside hydrolase family 3 protein [Zopfia rhizophila CBS 207.26]|uniref:beta-glucosidase n=1 Tax=Zopfia rhizophila CBS 207.26 TaxID=1314779 RepID=A0A6A6EFE0_9PEZI|nr:glycoside hydrolase family 3 protein [Zopfia rhizophila CBS 207.26]
MTLEEKANVTRGYTLDTNICSGHTGSVPRLSWPGMCLQDAGNGVRATDFVSAYPSGIHVGASWDRNLTYQRAYEMGLEFRKKGVNVLLGPMVGPLGRIPLSGRLWEGFSTDPYLSGILVAETIKGIQDAGVIPSLKHYIGNEQETQRTKYNETNAMSSNIDDKTLHELYLWPFMDGVQAGSASIMASYNRINNSYASQNSKLLNGILKTDLEFDGFVISDWRGQWTGVASALAGLDMTMPSGGYWGDNLTESVRNGSVSEDRLNDMATRILAAWYFVGQDNETFPEPGIGIQNLTLPHRIVEARRPESAAVLMEGAIGGHVLVKNTNAALPLQNQKLLSLFGYDAVAPSTKNTDVLFQLGYWSEPEMADAKLGTKQHFAQYALQGTVVTGGRAGANAPAYISAPYDAITARAAKAGIWLNWDFSSPNPDVNAASNACLVFINAMATEGWDREGLHDDLSDGLILRVASRCNNTIVVIHNAGVRLVDRWIDNPNVTAVVFAHLPGQDSGESLVRLLWGDEGAGSWGKLPYSVPKNESDYNVYRPCLGEKENLYPQCNFTEGVYIDYRDFDHRDVELRFEFGFGLSYSSFEYADLEVSAPKLGASACGSIEDLWEVVAGVSATITNVGEVTAAEVAQLYLGIPNSPPKQLRGFQKVELAPGKNGTVDFELTRRDLSTWSVEAQQWVIQEGEYKVFVGASSRDIRLSASFLI